MFYLWNRNRGNVEPSFQILQRGLRIPAYLVYKQPYGAKSSHGAKPSYCVVPHGYFEREPRNMNVDAACRIPSRPYHVAKGTTEMPRKFQRAAIVPFYFMTSRSNVSINLQSVWDHHCSGVGYESNGHLMK
jgi:hypothetical protein